MAANSVGREQFEQMRGGDRPLLVEFWAPWCGYCRRLGPVYERIAEEYSRDMEVVKLNIDEEPRLAEEAGVEVIPTLVLYKEGRALGSVVNPGSKAAIDQFIRETLNT